MTAEVKEAQRPEPVVVVLEPRQTRLRIVAGGGGRSGQGLSGRAFPLRAVEDVDETSAGQAPIPRVVAMLVLMDFLAHQSAWRKAHRGCFICI